jgi:hypothetical protein
VEGLVRLLTEEGAQRQLQAVTASYPDVEARIAKLVSYLELLPERERLLARLAPAPPAGEEEAKKGDNVK